MASANKGPIKSSEDQSRLRDPLNVVVEKVGATRATVRGDVSAESLKELLMSSLSLLPSTAADDQQNDNNKLQNRLAGYSDPESELNDLEEGNRKNYSKGANAKDRNKSHQSSRIKTPRIKDSVNSKTGKNLSDKRETSSNKKSRRNRGSKSEETDEEEESSLFSSSSNVFCSSTEEPTFSNDNRWLRSHFGKCLIQGLKDVAKMKPQDPVSYLAFFLRNWRSEEESRRRKKDFENDLQKQRLALTNSSRKLENSMETFEPESTFGNDEEEESGGKWDSNFREYYRG